MASVIRSRGRTKIGAARVQGGSISYINQAGASGRAAMQMGQAITKIGAQVHKLHQEIDDSLEDEQSSINLSYSKASWEATATAVHAAVINGGTGIVDENGNYETPWIPEDYEKSMYAAFRAMEDDPQYRSNVDSLNGKDSAIFSAWSASKFGELSGKVLNKGYTRRVSIQQSERSIVSGNLYRSSLTTDTESAAENYLEYYRHLYSRSQYGIPLSDTQIKSNDRAFVEHYTLTSLFGGANPDVPESNVTIEQYDNAIEKLLDQKYLTQVRINDDLALQGLSLEERTSVVTHLKDRRGQKEVVIKRLINEANTDTSNTLQNNIEQLTLKDIDSAVAANPHFIGTVQYKYFRSRVKDRTTSGVQPKENVSDYRVANSKIMRGEAIPNLSEKYRRDPTGTIVEVQEYLIQNVDKLSDTHYSGVEQMLKNYFGKTSPLGKHIDRLNTVVESRLKLKLYAERKGETVDFAGMGKDDVQAMLMSLMNESEQTKAEIQAQVDQRMVEWDGVRDARLGADKSGSAWIDLLDAPAIGSDGRVISGTENNKYIGDRMINSFIDGVSYSSPPPATSVPSRISAIEAVNNVASNWKSGYRDEIELQNGSILKYQYDNMPISAARNMYWNDVASEMYGTDKKMIIFDDPQNAPTGWLNGREPIAHLRARLTK